jgi:uroporphyrinogen-III synthase
LHTITAVLFYSPRTAKIFRKHSQAMSYNMDALCISQNTANELIGLKFNTLKIAATPDEDSMLELLNAG